MNVEVEEYRRMAAGEAVLALDDELSEEERNKHMDKMLKLNQQYVDLLKAEHDYNDPVRERKDRSVDLLKSVAGCITQIICYCGVAAVSGYVDTHDRLPGTVLKETWKKVRCK